MSTRSRIGIIRDSGDSNPVVESIYCHFDGYPEGVGQMLLDHWTDEDKINDLIELGDLSSLGSVIGEKHNFDDHMPHFWSDPIKEMLVGLSEDEATELRQQLQDESPNGKGWCCAFGRDRGEEDCGSRTHGLRDWPDYGQEAEYLFDPAEGKWWVSSPGQNPVGWNTVAAWHGFISIPDAIALNAKEEARVG